MPAEHDPMAELVLGLDACGKPPLAWVLRWSDGGTREPVAAAWKASNDPSAMLTYLSLSCGAGWAASLARRLLGWPRAQRRRLPSGRPGIWVMIDPGAADGPEDLGGHIAAARQVREAVACPPTLEDALASLDLPEHAGG